MAKSESPAGALFQDIHLSWPELVVRKTGDVEDQEGGGEGREAGGGGGQDRDGEKRESGPVTEGAAKEDSQGRPTYVCI